MTNAGLILFAHTLDQILIAADTIGRYTFKVNLIFIISFCYLQFISALSLIDIIPISALTGFERFINKILSGSLTNF